MLRHERVALFDDHKSPLAAEERGGCQGVEHVAQLRGIAFERRQGKLAAIVAQYEPANRLQHFTLEKRLVAEHRADRSARMLLRLGQVFDRADCARFASRCFRHGPRIL